MPCPFDNPQLMKPLPHFLQAAVLACVHLAVEVRPMPDMNCQHHFISRFPFSRSDMERVIESVNLITRWPFFSRQDRLPYLSQLAIRTEALRTSRHWMIGSICVRVRICSAELQFKTDPNRSAFQYRPLRPDFVADLMTASELTQMLQPRISGQSIYGLSNFC